MDEVEKLNDAELDFICNDPERVCNETFSDDDSLCNETMDQLEEQQVPDDEEQQVSDEEEGQSGAGLKFELYPHTDKRARKFGMHRRVFTTRLTQPTDLSKIPRANLPQLIEKALQQAINEQVLDGHENNNDWLMINMSSNRLKHAYNSHQVRVGQWRHDTQPARAILEKISNILNSNEQFEIDDSFHIEVSHIRDAGTGSGTNQEKGPGRRLNPKITAVEKVLKNKKSVVMINNQDELCCARALVTAQAFHEYGYGHNTYNNIKMGLSEQERRAKALHREARVPEGPCGTGEIQQFQIILSDYQIVVVSVDHGYQITFKGPAQPKQLVLVKNGDHYHACNSLSGFMGKSYYCVECEKGFNEDNLANHRCKGKKCFACHQVDCSDFKNAHGQEARLPCDACNRFFFGEVCKAHHRLRKSSGTTANPGDKNSVCDTHRRCKVCNKTYTKQENKGRHLCGYVECPSCHEYLNLAIHQCYVQKVTEKPKRKNRKRKRGAAAGLATLRANENEDEDEEEKPPPPPLFVYFDIEARQEDGQHVANLLCAERDDRDQCEVFEGEQCVEAFLDWLEHQSKTDDPDVTRPVIAVAHNFQGYDSYFILDEYYKQKICPKQIVNGAKILSMEVGSLKFVDSMAFLQMPLSGFTKAFGLTELKKGFFPHFFNTQENQDYEGVIPAQDYYDPMGMKPERRQEFEAWHKTKREENYVFKFQRELVDYCVSDVRLLKEGCMQFQQEFKTLADFNPMQECITIASACNRYYRKKCMEEYTIASEPLRGWHGKSKPHSFASMEWLHWIDHQLRQERHTTENVVAHAGNTGEHMIRLGARKIHVDGYDSQTNTVYEFQGCFYHGCPSCFPNRDQKHKKLNDMTMRQIHRSTQERNQVIRDHGYGVVEVWECDWNAQKKADVRIQNFLHNLKLVPRLEPRDAFFGGRTNAVQLHCETRPGEEIHYYDYTSLYPWVNKNCDYPEGHPIIITQPPSNDITNFFGLVKCTINPPYELYHPVLPYRCEGKLTFPLCRTCVETQLKLPLLERSVDCPHSQEERALTGTWCTPEIQEALAQGYTLQKIHEIWHFPRTSKDLFASYVNTFLKIKQEASGWPQDVGSDPHKREGYLLDYQRHEGIQLDYENVKKNPGKRSLAKMMLNSFWGKFGQQANKCQVEAITEPSKLYDLLNDDSKQLHSIRIANEELLEVVHDSREECASIQPNINIFVACFTTCWARLKLYEGIKTLQPQQVLYFDTDSLIYHWSPGLPKLPLGNYLGQFTDELDKDDFIVEFAAAGPKNYGYKTSKGKVECKVRGFSLNSRGQQQLNFDILKDNVKAELQRPEVEPRGIPVWNPFKIVRDQESKQLLTLTEIKRYKLVFDKRVVDPTTFRSHPYGFKRYQLSNIDDELVQGLMETFDDESQE